MALDPRKWTLKTQEAVNAAASSWRKRQRQPRAHPRPPAGRAAPPGRQRRACRPRSKLGLAPLMVRNQADEAVAKLPKAYGGDEPRLGRELDQRRSTRPSSAASDLQRRLPLDRAPAARAGRPPRRRHARSCCSALQEVRGSHRVTSQNPEEQYQALEKYGRDLTEARPRGQARPGHRPRRGDPPRHPGAVAAHQEQPGAHRRARRRQDRHRRGPRPAHRRGRRARGPARTSASSRSTSARWSPAPSTAASSRSGSRPCSRRSPTPTARSSPSSTSCTRSSAPARPRARWTPAT